MMTGPHAFDWTVLDARLKSIAARGRQAVIRIYVDWPGWNTGVPRFLLEQGIRTNAPPVWRKNDPFVPDFNDPKLRAAMREFISAWGEAFDGRPEIGFIEAGLLGVWGEWLKESSISVETQKEVVEAYKKAFPTTKVLFRFPNELTVACGVGYHDD
jgi:hypothetical protein